ncbi:unnamed protein product [Caenorhabditis bovis]|uniref:Uncharacterized protein n=1 Tax=Caenorhabditis bovis TaxID=2654633 RepID=A0A8S1F9F4_9PELO|nr:unnamed protein product [Caenorhabditis bovis]
MEGGCGDIWMKIFREILDYSVLVDELPKTPDSAVLMSIANDIFKMIWSYRVQCMLNIHNHCLLAVK